MPLFIPDDYTAKLAPETMEQAISHLKEIFPDKLARSGCGASPPRSSCSRARASTTT